MNFDPIWIEILGLCSQIWKNWKHNKIINKNNGTGIYFNHVRICVRNTVLDPQMDPDPQHWNFFILLDVAGAPAAAAAKAAAPAAAAKKEEPEEEEDDDMGFGLFD